jgi:hypothetical protein
MATFKLEQGSAPAVSLKDGEPMWQFINRQAETDDPKLAAKMVKAGAIITNADEASEIKKGGRKKAAAETSAEDESKDADSQDQEAE